MSAPWPAKLVRIWPTPLSISCCWTWACPTATASLLTPLAALLYRFDNMLADESLSDENLLRVVDSQRTEPVLVAKLVDEVSDEVQDRLPVLDLTLKQEVPAGFELGNCNRGLLFTLLFNLVSNAIKSQPRRRPDLPAGPACFRGGRVRAGEVRDTGRDIAKEQLPRLFHRFDKGATAHPDSYSLGLSIARTIADLHGIEIEVHSIEGLGTLFLFTFPPAEVGL